jgi:hypothetical protein
VGAVRPKNGPYEKRLDKKSRNFVSLLLGLDINYLFYIA